MRAHRRIRVYVSLTEVESPARIEVGRCGLRTEDHCGRDWMPARHPVVMKSEDDRWKQIWILKGQNTLNACQSGKNKGLQVNCIGALSVLQCRDLTVGWFVNRVSE